MGNFLLYILEWTVCISVFYLLYRLVMHKETGFVLNRSILLAVIVASALIPLVKLPQLTQIPVHVAMIPELSENEIQIQNFPVKMNTGSGLSLEMAGRSGNKLTMSLEEVLIYSYLAGVLIALMLLARNIAFVLLVFRKATVLYKDGCRLMLTEREVPSFAFAGSICMSKSDYEFYGSAILPHEKAHITLNHFYDLMLLELVKAFHWFNPMIYRLARDMKEIHEFQADGYALHSGIDSERYQLLLIQKCVGPKRFVLVNSFNHCQIKKRIAMMNKQKSGKAWRWKVATFLPLLAFLLMAFGKRTDRVPLVKTAPSLVEMTAERLVVPSGGIQTQDEQKDRVIMIKGDGNYIAGKSYPLHELVQRGKEWDEASNDWIRLQIDEAIPYKRVDEVKEALLQAGIVHVTQSIPHSDEIIYPVGDVSKTVKFSQGKWSDWMMNQLDRLTNGQYKNLEYRIAYCFVIDKNGKVSDGRIVEASPHPEINAAVEKMLAQIPDWEPAKRGTDAVNVLYRETFGNRVKKTTSPAEKK